MRKGRSSTARRRRKSTLGNVPGLDTTSNMDSETWKKLNRLEREAEKLPYKHLKIEVTFSDGTDLVYEKDKTPPIGFIVNL